MRDLVVNNQSAAKLSWLVRFDCSVRSIIANHADVIVSTDPSTNITVLETQDFVDDRLIAWCPNGVMLPGLKYPLKKGERVYFDGGVNAFLLNMTFDVP